jgi:spore germination cell wall hydrolase CwlJ-like protein
MWKREIIAKRRRRKVISPLLCVAMAVYFEARGEQQIAGHIAIAEVIENRVQDSRFPDDHCSVVKQGRSAGAGIRSSTSASSRSTATGSRRRSETMNLGELLYW